jgi:CRISPR-associated protein Csm5
MNKLHTKLNAEITVLSPLHVSSGQKLLRDFDWLARNSRVYVFDQQALFDLVLTRAEKDRGDDLAAITDSLMGMSLPDLERAGWLEQSDFREDSPIFRYILRGEPHMGEISEQIKDVYGRPYLPGSSLKGALRTLIAHSIYTTQKQTPDLQTLKPSRSWAAQPLEKSLFGRDPNHDWLRALQVSDSPALSPDSLRLEGVNVFPTARQGQAGLNLDLETIREGTTFTVPITIDEYGFQPEIAKQLSWEGQRRWLTDLAKLGRTYNRHRLSNEAEYLPGKNAPRATRLFYHRLINNEFGNLAKDEFLLQVGWGSGWGSKTLGDLLQKNKAQFARIVTDHRLSRSRKPFQPGDLFPSSRKLVLRGGATAVPLGWLKIKLQEVEL